MENISFEDFKKLDIRVGEIKNAEKVEEADKLLKLSVDIGEEEPRQIIAGIAEFLGEPAELVGGQYPFLVNIEPRHVKGEISNGMILAVSGPDSEFSLLSPDSQMPPGSRIC